MVCFRSSVGYRGDARPHRDYKYTKFSKKTRIPGLSPAKKHPSRSLRRLPDRPPSGSGTALVGPRIYALFRTVRPFRTATCEELPAAARRSIPGPPPTPPARSDKNRPAAGPIAAAKAGRSLRSTPRRKPTSGPPPGEAAARATLRSRKTLDPQRPPTPRIRSCLPATSSPDDTGPLAPSADISSRPAVRCGATPHSGTSPAARLSARHAAPRHTPAPRRTSLDNTACHRTTQHDTTRPVPLHRATPARIPSERHIRQLPASTCSLRQRPSSSTVPPPGPRPAPFPAGTVRCHPTPSDAFRYRPTTASSSSTVTGSRRSPSMRHPSSVTSRSSSMRIPPKSR